MYLYSSLRKESNPKSFIRLLHASPNAPSVDVYFNNQLITSNFNYKDFTEYISIFPGIYNIKVFPHGKTSSPIIDTNINILPKKIITVAATNNLENIELIPYEEPKLPIPPGNAYVKFVHLSPGTPNVDITLPDGTILFKDVQFQESTEYIPLKVGTYTVEAKPSGSDKTVLIVPNITLKPNRFYTIYAVGYLNDTPPIQVLIPLDGNSYINL